MARIAFLPLPEIGHTNATFKLARQLRARGHHVRYLARPDMEEHVRSRGWDFSPLFEHLFPKGHLEAMLAVLDSPERSRAEKKAAMKDLIPRHAGQFSQTLFSPDFEERLASQADMVLVDATYPLPALTALKRGIPAALFCVTLPLRADPLVPPLNLTLTPGEGLWYRLRLRAGWARHTLGREIGFMGKQLAEFSRQYPELGRLCGWRSHFQHGPDVNLETLVACCQELDFPRASTENLHYIGPSVDLDRPEPPLPPEVERDGRPLLYCTLGSVGTRAQQYVPFLQAVLDAAAGKPDWRLLMAVGKHVQASELRSPPNATVVASAPQLSALRRASLMITHGGLNTVKECICLGVPMIAFPCQYDQPGNGARIAHHGLGLRGDVRRATAPQLSSMIDEVAGDPRYRRRLKAMQEVFLAANESDRGVERVERLLAQGPATSPRARSVSTIRSTPASTDSESVRTTTSGASGGS